VLTAAAGHGTAASQLWLRVPMALLTAGVVVALADGDLLPPLPATHSPTGHSCNYYNEFYWQVIHQRRTPPLLCLFGRGSLQQRQL
jgi:hypothetical protein